MMKVFNATDVPEVTSTIPRLTESDDLDEGVYELVFSASEVKIYLIVLRQNLSSPKHFELVKLYFNPSCGILEPRQSFGREVIKTDKKVIFDLI